MLNHKGNLPKSQYIYNCKPRLHVLKVELERKHVFGSVPVSLSVACCRYIVNSSLCDWIRGVYAVGD